MVMVVAVIATDTNFQMHLIIQKKRLFHYKMTKKQITKPILLFKMN